MGFKDESECEELPGAARKCPTARRPSSPVPGTRQTNTRYTYTSLPSRTPRCASPTTAITTGPSNPPHGAGRKAITNRKTGGTLEALMRDAGGDLRKWSRGLPRVGHSWHTLIGALSSGDSATLDGWRASLKVDQGGRGCMTISLRQRTAPRAGWPTRAEHRRRVQRAIVWKEGAIYLGGVSVPPCVDNTCPRVVNNSSK